ncbi:MAG: molybdopterin-dependent oxidoreductase [Chloroflexi bacterium]|nr:molybdopterin-dependent oxidoreductase [Chloroflexota bacterium]
MQKRFLNVNGVDRTIIVDPEAMLADVIRKQMHLTGTKVSCNDGHCGACSVMVDGKLTLACITPLKRVADGAKIITVEGIGQPGNLHPIQAAMAALGAAQCGFCTPGFVVSTKALLDKHPNPTREEVRAWLTQHHNACRCTGYKPIVDAIMEAAAVMRGEKPIEDILFKMPKDGRIWGTNYPRPTAEQKVSGTLKYGQDLGLEMPAGTLQLALVQAKVSHANILSIDTSEAEKMPGVVKVVTHKDVKGKNRITGLITFPSNKGDGWDRPILCDTKVFQYGDAIAIVCADTIEQAKAAAEKVKVELEMLPAYMSAPAAMADDAIEIHPGTPNAYYEQKVVKGPDTAPIMETAPYVVEDSFYLQRQPHLTIESDMGFAYYDEEGRLTIQSKSIGVVLHQLMIAPGIGVEPEKLRLIQNPAGGTFGYKFSPTMEALLGVACVATQRPVYLEYDYQQFMQYTGKRSPFWIDIKLAADKNGKIVAMEHDYLVDHGPYSEFGDLLTLRGVQYIGAGYNIPSIRGRGRTVATNHSWGSAFRAYGSPQAFLASESLVDELAEKVGMDPLEFRYLNAYRPGSTTPNGQDPEVYSLPEMFEKLRPIYKEAKEQAARESTPENKKGVGITLGIYGCGLDAPDAAEAWIELTKTGVTVYTTWHDHGQGADMGVVGTAHEALRQIGIKPQQIALVLNDTARTPWGGPAGGSRSQVVIGNAIVNGCDQLVAALTKKDGTFRTYDEMVAENLPLKYVGKWGNANINTGCDANGQGSPFTIYMYGLFLAEVSVNTKTGKTTVEGFTAMADIGKINNKLVVDGQMYGGIAQGIGLALSEDFEDIEKHSTMLGAGIPYAKDIPDKMNIIYFENAREQGPHGAAGVGELPLTSPHVAVVNAIYNATGVRITHLPARPEKVLAGLKELETKKVLA